MGTAEVGGLADHVDSDREGFAECVVQLQEDPWHRWDHGWIAEG